MPATPRGDMPARDAIASFLRHLGAGGMSATTIRIRQHFLTEYLRHVQQATGEADPSAAVLMTPGHAAAWLDDAAAGKTRTRNTLHGPDAGAHRNSMRVRIDSVNALAEYLGRPLRLETLRPEDGGALTPADARELLQLLAARRPVHANAATAVRTAAVAALVAATGRTVPELAGLNVRDIHLDGTARVDLGTESCPLGDDAALVLRRWLTVRASITAELEGSDPGYLWIPTKPGRPRGGSPPVPPGLSRAAVRTLHHSHRTLVSQLLGGPVRPGTLRILHEDAQAVPGEDAAQQLPHADPAGQRA